MPRFDATGSRHDHRQPVGAVPSLRRGRPDAADADAPAPGARRPSPAFRRPLDQARAGPPRRPRRRRPARRPRPRPRAVAPFVAGQTVTVRLYAGAEAGREGRAVKPVPGTPNGGFVVSLKPRSGRLTVRASHRATPGAGDDGREGQADARGHAPRGSRRPRPDRAAGAEPPGRPALRRLAIRPVRRVDRARRHRLPQDQGHEPRGESSRAPSCEGLLATPRVVQAPSPVSTASTSRSTSRARFMAL